MAFGFHAKDDPIYPYCTPRAMENYHIPGFGHAATLPSSRLGL